LAENPESITKQSNGLDGDALKNNDVAEWDAVWSDDDDEKDAVPDDNGEGNVPAGLPPLSNAGKKKSRDENGTSDNLVSKKRKVSLYRSELASLLQQCSEGGSESDDGRGRFQRATEYVGGLGPSAIDVALSSLCNGSHDFEEGIPLLILASQWLIEACRSRERFDAVNAYLHRFLYLHSNTLAMIKEEDFGQSSYDREREESIGDNSTDKGAVAADENRNSILRSQRLELMRCMSSLKEVQCDATRMLQEEMQNTLCLLRHFSRMV